ncbi:MAG: phosphoribosylformylglycinamidine cyclo-ligase, partial [Bifidobacteriaceae bacterium]|nr:phosphoribosylformylglycinamidine cyclo-ligase [Bifidobacteriaceae bacterium]
ATELTRYRRPLLAASTDGVGTKVAIAQALGVHDTIGQDLVAMVVDDIVVTGARPLVMTDYIATGEVVPEVIAGIVRGIAEGCVATGTSLVGGETAEHPGLMGPGEYDLAGAAVGVVEADALLGAHRVGAGDAVLGIDASGLHSNGYSLVRAVLARAGWELSRDVPEFGRTLGQELLEPTALYTRACLGLVERLGPRLHALAHVTGGGLAANLARVLPPGCDAAVRRDAWEVPPVFQVLRRLGGLDWADLERTWNLGIGMVAVVDPAAAGPAVADLADFGLRAQPIGEVMAADSPALGLARVADADVVSGAKGVRGGRVVLSAAYR